MRHRNRRLTTLAAAGAVLIAAIALGLFAFRDAVVFFYSPSEVAEAPPEAGERVRVGGLVLEGSVQNRDGGVVSFGITDGAATVDVLYSGLLPDLFREGQGVVTEGRFGADGYFHAEQVLAKHDETYMPPEVAEALRESGVWQGDEDAGSPED